MIFLLKYWKYIAAAMLAVVLFFSGWLVNGWRIHSTYQRQLIAEQEKARDISIKLIGEKDNEIAKLVSEKDAINVRLNNVIGELHNRSERMPDNSRSSCNGLSGKELARGDAEFLARYASYAAYQQKQLGACINLYNKVKKELNK